jgi:hypothetical protein
MTTSVAETLAEAAAREGVDIGDVTPGSGDREAINANLGSDRGFISVTTEPDGQFQVLFADGGIEWARGWTTDPGEVVRAIAAWRSGVRLRALTERFPFMRTSGLAQAHEDGRALEYRWEKLLERPDTAPLVRALRAHPVLGVLEPTVSHGNFFRLAVGGTGLDYAEVHVIQLRDGIEVEGSWGVPARKFSAIDDAVAEAAALVQARQHHLGG